MISNKPGLPGRLLFLFGGGAARFVEADAEVSFILFLSILV